MDCWDLLLFCFQSQLRHRRLVSFCPSRRSSQLFRAIKLHNCFTQNLFRKSILLMGRPSPGNRLSAVTELCQCRKFMQVAEGIRPHLRGRPRIAWHVLPRPPVDINFFSWKLWRSFCVRLSQEYCFHLCPFFPQMIARSSIPLRIPGEWLFKYSFCGCHLQFGDAAKLPFHRFRLPILVLCSDDYTVLLYLYTSIHNPAA